VKLPGVLRSLLRDSPETVTHTFECSRTTADICDTPQFSIGVIPKMRPLPGAPGESSWMTLLVNEQIAVNDCFKTIHVVRGSPETRIRIRTCRTPSSPNVDRASSSSPSNPQRLWTTNSYSSPTGLTTDQRPQVRRYRTSDRSRTLRLGPPACGFKREEGIRSCRSATFAGNCGRLLRPFFAAGLTFRVADFNRAGSLRNGS